jgi:hypothetical protein
LVPWTSLSTPNTPGLRPSELSSSPGIALIFQPKLPLSRSPTKPTRLSNGASAASSPGKSRVPTALPEGLVRGGTFCSPGLFDLSGSLPLRPLRKVSLFPRSPLALTLQIPHETCPDEPQGLPTEKLGISPFRAPARLAFRPTAPTTFLKNEPPAGYFFTSDPHPSRET